MINFLCHLSFSFSLRKCYKLKSYVCSVKELYAWWIMFNSYVFYKMCTGSHKIGSMWMHEWTHLDISKTMDCFFARRVSQSSFYCKQLGKHIGYFMCFFLMNVVIVLPHVFAPWLQGWPHWGLLSIFTQLWVPQGLEDHRTSSQYLKTHHRQTQACFNSDG